MAEQQEGALARWSRLKRQGTAEQRPAAATAEPVEETAETALAAGTEEVASDEHAEEPVDLEALPDVETLGYESDFTPFLRAGVPEELQRLALRKLWASNPVLANIDGLNDYDLDYDKTDPVMRVGEFLMSREERSGPPPQRPPEVPRPTAEARSGEGESGEGESEEAPHEQAGEELVEAGETTTGGDEA